MNRRIGFIGCGNMASAMIGGILKKGLVQPEDLTASDVSDAARQKAEQAFGICTAADNRTVAEGSDILFLAVKPPYIDAVIEEIREGISEQVIISIAPGKSLEHLEEAFGRKIPLVRVMPNTPALVGEGMSALCPNDAVTGEQLAAIREIFESFGRAEVVPERLMDVVTGVSGSGPAYVFMFIEAMADAAVLDGMPRDMAYSFAAQTVLGSAKMVLETGMHPGSLKDMVCSPGGTTIEAVRVLEEMGFRGAVIEAVHACTEKARG